MKKLVHYTKFAFTNKRADEKTLVGDSYQNCQIIDEKLHCGLRVSTCLNASGQPITMPANNLTPTRLFCLYRRVSGTMTPYLAAFFGDGQMCYYDQSLNNNAGGWVEDYKFESPTQSVTVQEEGGANRTYFFNNKGVFYYATAIAKTTTGKTLPIGCVSNGRVFTVAKGCKIIYSKAYVYSNYDVSLEDAGYIMLPVEHGEVCAIVDFQGMVYVLCEHGIYLLEAVGSALDFKVSKIEYVGEKIIGSSVTVCGDACICFLTHGGVYAFDGKEVKQISKNILVQPNRVEEAGYGVYYDGKYHVLYKTERYQMESIMVDLATGEGCLMTMPTALSVINGEVYCVENNQVKKVDFIRGELMAYGQGEFRLVTDFGTSKRKTISRIWINGAGNFHILIGTNNAMKVLDCSSYVNPKKCFNVNRSGEDITLAISLQGTSRVDELSIEYETIG